MMVFSATLSPIVNDMGAGNSRCNPIRVINVVYVKQKASSESPFSAELR